jgi:hypothetical protein
VFGFEAYHVLLAAVGASIILSFWLPRFLSGASRPPPLC